MNTLTVNEYEFFFAIQSNSGHLNLIPIALGLNRNILSNSITIQLLEYVVQEAEEVV